MSAKPEATDAPAKAPAKNKKLLIIVGGLVLILAISAGGAFFYISKQRAAAEAEADGEDAPAASAKADSHEKATPPTYLPLDSMVVNLADPGGDKVAQIGIIFQVTDAKASDSVKAYLPTIRSSILMLVSQRTAEDLLKPEGKESLAKDILRHSLVPFGGSLDEEEEHPPEEEAPSKKKKKKEKSASEHADMPIVGVLFSSFIVQ